MMNIWEVETGLKVGGHPGRNTGTAYRMILTTSEPYPGAYVGEALEWYARVFAAAPELLAALIRLREWVRNPGADDGPENEAVIDQVEAAIAKAEGRERP